MLQCVDGSRRRGRRTACFAFLMNIDAQLPALVFGI